MVRYTSGKHAVWLVKAGRGGECQAPFAGLHAHSARSAVASGRSTVRAPFGEPAVALRHPLSSFFLLALALPQPTYAPPSARGCTQRGLAWRQT